MQAHVIANLIGGFEKSGFGTLIPFFMPDGQWRTYPNCDLRIS